MIISHMNLETNVAEINLCGVQLLFKDIFVELCTKIVHAFFMISLTGGDNKHSLGRAELKDSF